MKRQCLKQDVLLFQEYKIGRTLPRMDCVIAKALKKRIAFKQGPAFTDSTQMVTFTLN